MKKSGHLSLLWSKFTSFFAVKRILWTMKKYYKLISIGVLLVFFTFLGVNIALQKIHDIEAIPISEIGGHQEEQTSYRHQDESTKQIMVRYLF